MQGPGADRHLWNKRHQSSVLESAPSRAKFKERVWLVLLEAPPHARSPDLQRQGILMDRATKAGQQGARKSGRSLCVGERVVQGAVSPEMAQLCARCPLHLCC